jgi:hypothetical protein
MAVNALKGAFHAARRGPPEATGGLAVCFLAFLPLICHLKIITCAFSFLGYISLTAV